ncbi:MAG TPA: aldose epimerase family protein, partial [Saprospiraceae bacterium]|nr:aldose epimerase family protein [Saprospiraceae bacterium]
PFRGFRGRQIFGTTPSGDEVTEFTLTNGHGIELKVINYGCTITSLKVPDRHGVFADIVLGYDDLEGYLQSNAYIGCVVGRFANRIAHGKFSLEGKEYKLAQNLPPHHLHGGVKGFSHAVWAAEEIDAEDGVGIRFRHMSPDGDEGYPGNLQLEVTYMLGDDDTLSFAYHASTDQPTIINLTQHTYFNLHGNNTSILDHQLMIHADHFLPVDETMIPTGEIRKVDGSPFDFRTPKEVGRDIGEDDIQLAIGHGYDHCWVFNHPSGELQHAATLYDPSTGRKMDVYTTEPGMQLYTANFLQSKKAGKNKIALAPRSGLCLETQHYPDSPHQPGFPSVVLRPGDEFRSKTLLKFSMEKV